MPTPLIPRKTLFGNPESESVSVSRDGTRIAWLAPLDGVLNVWVAPASDIAAARAVTRDAKRGIRIYFWSRNPDILLYAQDRDGDENWHVYAVDLRDDSIRDLTPYDDVHAVPEPPSPRFPDEVLIGVNDRDPQVHDVHRVNILTGESRLVTLNDIGAAGFVSDMDYAVRLAHVVPPEGGARLLAPDGAGGWDSFAEIGAEDDMTTFPLGFAADGRRLYMLDSRGRDTAALVQTDVDSGETRELASDPKADAGGIVLNPATREPQAVAFEYDRVRWQVLDDAIAGDFRLMRERFGDEFEIVSRSADDGIWIVRYDRDAAPAEFHLYDRAAGNLEFLFTNRPALEDAPLAPMRSRVVRSRDGLDLVTYVTMPPDADAAGAPPPAVLLVHGGPWARDSWGYDPYHQLLANRGCAAISVNFRGSTGFGKRFLNAGNMEWAGRMHDDLIDVVEWAVSERLADRDRIAIMGGSYGGYAALVGLAFTPAVFACGVDIVGPSNLNTLLESVPPYWQPMLAMFHTRVGDNTTDEGAEFLRQRSPLTRADAIIRPLLIAQGANDPRVKRAESDQIADAMNRRGVPVTYLLYPDEGHGFARPENNLSFTAAAEAFLARHIGARAEPAGDDLDGSSLEILSGDPFGD